MASAILPMVYEAVSFDYGYVLNFSYNMLLEYLPKNTLSTKKASLQRIRLEFSDPNLFEYNSNSYIVYLSEGWLT